MLLLRRSLSFHPSSSFRPLQNISSLHPRPFSTTPSSPTDSPLLITHHPLPSSSPTSNATITTLTLNRPRARNAFNRALLSDLNKAIATIKNDQHTRVVLLKSSTPTTIFCAGADLKERATMSPEETTAFVEDLRKLMDNIENLPVPTIAVLEGGAFGGGLELALACDMRMAGQGVSVGLTETSLAIIPGAGGTQRLPRLVGEARAKEMVFRAQRLKGDEALKYGILNHLFDSSEELEKETQKICEEIAGNGPVAVRMAKTAIHQGMQVDIIEGLYIEKCCYSQILPTEDRLEGLRAFKEKRKPVYKGC